MTVVERFSSSVQLGGYIVQAFGRPPNFGSVERVHAQLTICVVNLGSVDGMAKIDLCLRILRDGGFDEVVWYEHGVSQDALRTVRARVE